MAQPEAESNGVFPASDNAGQTATSIARAEAITADEIALYDRQIRLWGVKAQEQIRTANILLVSAKALANEIAKNLVLAGIASLTIVDHQPVTDDDVGAQFFVSEELVGQNRAEAAAPQIRKLNPRVNVTASTANINQLAPDYYSPFTLVIGTDLDFNTLSNVNAATRITNKPFYAAGTHGFYGYIFADLIQHDYVIERAKSNVATVVGPESATRSIVSASTKRENGKVVELVTKREIYSPFLLANSSPLPPETLNSVRKLKNVTPLLPCIRALWEFEKATGNLPSHSHADLQTFTRLAHDKVKELQLPMESLKADFLRSFLQNLGSEIAPVTAFLGGMLAQDAINVLGRRQQPIQNLVLFDGEESKGPVYALHPIFQDGLDALPPIDATMGASIDANGIAMPMPMGGLDGLVAMNGTPAVGMNGMGMDPTLHVINGTVGGMGDMAAMGIGSTMMPPVDATNAGGNGSLDASASEVPSGGNAEPATDGMALPPL